MSTPLPQTTAPHRRLQVAKVYSPGGHDGHYWNRSWKSNSAAAVLRGGRPVIIPSAEGMSIGGKAFPSYVAITAEVADAVLGTSLEVPTFDGEVSVKVPPGTQPDSVLWLKGKGLPRFGSRGQGDVLLRIQVHVPERLSVEERKLYERLQSLACKE